MMSRLTSSIQKMTSENMRGTMAMQRDLRCSVYGAMAATKSKQKQSVKVNYNKAMQAITQKA
jgi:hypothetical protein